jgi:hypothetical protein
MVGPLPLNPGIPAYIISSQTSSKRWVCVTPPLEQMFSRRVAYSWHTSSISPRKSLFPLCPHHSHTRIVTRSTVPHQSLSAFSSSGE